jgi:hypothetical protein
VIGRLIYGPPDYLVTKFSARERRTFGFWTAVIAIVLLPVFGRMVFYVSILSVLALIPNFTAETPVESEDEA